MQCQFQNFDGKGDLMGPDENILAKLKAAMDAKGLTCQKVAKLTEERGEAVSESTIRRMVKEGARLDDFRYETSVRPVVRIVLGLDEETEKPNTNDPEQLEQYYTTIEALKPVVDFKHSQIVEQESEIEALRAELSELKRNRKEEIEKVENADQKKIDYLKETIKDLKDAAKWYKRVIGILGVFCFLVLVALILDLSIGHIGWIRY